MTSATQSLPQVETQYDVIGDGETIVLLHRIFASHARFSRP